jgi:hypothetical protein
MIVVKTHTPNVPNRRQATRFPVNISLALDPAVTDKKHSDASGFTVVACDPEGVWWIYEGEDFHGQPDAVVDRTVFWATIYRPPLLSLETHAAQVLFKSLLTPAFEKAKLETQIIEYTAPNKYSKHARISALQPLFKQGKIRIRRGLTRLIYELENYAGPDSLDHDDVIDSLSQHILIARPSQRRLVSASEAKETEVAPSKRGEPRTNADPGDGTWTGGFPSA